MSRGMLSSTNQLNLVHRFILSSIFLPSSDIYVRTCLLNHRQQHATVDPVNNIQSESNPNAPQEIPSSHTEDGHEDAQMPAESGSGAENTGKKRTFNLFLGNISHSATEEDIRKAFEPFGTVENVRLIIDKVTGRSRFLSHIHVSS